MSYRVGEVIAQRYQVVNLIGTGSGGEVYKVWDKMRSTHLALKLLKPEWNSNPQLVSNFLDEAKSLSNLQHPHIVRFYELVDTGDSAFFLMDYVDGVTLRKVIKASYGSLPLKQILFFITPICKALNYAHQQNVIHCDVKPENIMIDQNGTVYLTDFGIALTRGNENNFLGTAGTPAYMAPEQIQGSVVNPQTDIYALGIVLYELFTGVKPFQGITGSQQQSVSERIRWEQVRLQPVPPAQINPLLDKHTNEVILKCLQKNPRQRYFDTIELMHALEEISTPKPTITKLNKEMEETKKDQVSVRKKPTVPLIIALIMVVLVISLAFAMGQSNRDPRVEIVRPPLIIHYPDACMDIQLQPDAILEECVTSVNIGNDGTVTVNFRWKLVSSPLNFGVNILADSNNHNMYLLDDLGNRLDHISTGGGTNQNVTLNLGDFKDGWFLFPALAAESSGFYFFDEDNQMSTGLLEKRW